MRNGDVDPDEAVVGGVDELRPGLALGGPEDPGAGDRQGRRREDVVDPQVARSAVAEVGGVVARVAPVAGVRPALGGGRGGGALRSPASRRLSTSGCASELAARPPARILHPSDRH